MRLLKKQLFSGGPQAEFSLFPFLSLLLCVLGIMSFLQLVFAFIEGAQVELKTLGSHQGVTPYQVICTAEGAMLIPPKSSEVPDSLRQGDERIEPLLRARDKERRVIHTSKTNNLADTVKEISIMNELGRKMNHSYEEIITVGIYPDGIECYFKLLEEMAKSRFQIRYGVFPLNPDWHIKIEVGLDSINDQRN